MKLLNLLKIKVIVVTMCLCEAKAVQVVVNGGFEVGTPGTTDAYRWNDLEIMDVGRGLVTVPSAAIPGSPEGGQFLLSILNFDQSVPFGPTAIPSINNQLLQGLTIGATYELSFFQANAGHGGAAGAWAPGSFEISVGGYRFQSDEMDFLGDGNQVWEEQKFSFVADRTDMPLQFTVHSDVMDEDLDVYMAIDGVSVTAVTGVPSSDSSVPEATSSAMIALAGGLLSLRRRRNARGWGC